MGGYENIILEVDLFLGGKMDISEVSEDDKERFIGGSGVLLQNSFLIASISDQVPFRGKPLMILNGPLTGTNLPGTSRLSFVEISSNRGSGANPRAG